MATTGGARRKRQKYPDEFRERAVRMVQEVRRETGETMG
jgi:transposase-like protein